MRLQKQELYGNGNRPRLDLNRKRLCLRGFIVINYTLATEFSGMQATRVLQRAAGAMPQAEVSKLVSDAAKRASASQKKKKGLRRYSDVIVLGLTTVVAATAINRKRQYQEYKEITEAKLSRLEMEKDTAMRDLQNIRQCLSAEAEEGLRVALVAGDGRVDRLKEWIDQCFDRTNMKPEADGGRKPDLI